MLPKIPASSAYRQNTSRDAQGVQTFQRIFGLRVFVLLQQSIIENTHDFARLQGNLHLLFDIGVPSVHQELQAVILLFQVTQLDDLRVTGGALHVVDVELGKVAGDDPPGPLGVGQLGGVAFGLLERGQQGTVGLLDGLVQLFAQALLLNEDMSGRDKAVNETGVVQHNLIFKGDELVRFLYPVDLLEQGQPKGLAVALLIALALPIGGKLFRSGAALCICHGGIPPVAFSTGYHTKPHFSIAIYKICQAQPIIKRPSNLPIQSPARLNSDG